MMTTEYVWIGNDGQWKSMYRPDAVDAVQHSGGAWYARGDLCDKWTSEIDMLKAENYKLRLKLQSFMPFAHTRSGADVVHSSHDNDLLVAMDVWMGKGANGSGAWDAVVRLARARLAEIAPKRQTPEERIKELEAALEFYAKDKLSVHGDGGERARNALKKEKS